MKNIIIIFSLLVSINVYSQESTLDKIAIKTCEYLETDEIKQLDSSQRVIKLGVYIINLYSDYKNELEAEGIVINFSDGSEAGRKFGEMVGINMANFCPDTLIALSGDVSLDDDSDEFKTFKGEIKSIKGDDFCFINVENSNGIIQKFLWLSNFIGSEKIISNDFEIGMSVVIKYKNTECFSPKLNEYIIRKEIVEIEYIN